MLNLVKLLDVEQIEYKILESSQVDTKMVELLIDFNEYAYALGIIRRNYDSIVKGSEFVSEREHLRILVINLKN